MPVARIAKPLDLYFRRCEWERGATREKPAVDANVVERKRKVVERWNRMVLRFPLHKDILKALRRVSCINVSTACCMHILS